MLIINKFDFRFLIKKSIYWAKLFLFFVRKYLFFWNYDFFDIIISVTAQKWLYFNVWFFLWKIMCYFLWAPPMMFCSFSWCHIGKKFKFKIYILFGHDKKKCFYFFGEKLCLILVGKIKIFSWKICCNEKKIFEIFMIWVFSY